MVETKKQRVVSEISATGGEISHFITWVRVVELQSRFARPAPTCVTQPAGGPWGRKLPGFTVASEAPPPPPSSLPPPALPHLSSLFWRLLEKPQSAARSFQTTGGCSVWFFLGGGASWLLSEARKGREGGAITYPSAATLPPQVTVTAERRCTSRGNADQVERMKHSWLFFFFFFFFYNQVSQAALRVFRAVETSIQANGHWN